MSIKLFVFLRKRVRDSKQTEFGVFTLTSQLDNLDQNKELNCLFICDRADDKGHCLFWAALSALG